MGGAKGWDEGLADDEKVAPEAVAKAALLNFLRGQGRFRGDTAIISELTIGKWSNRADLALCNGRLAAFEIKTREDSLARLDAQLAAYSTCFDEVSVVAASRHMNAVISRAPEHVGVYELQRTSEGPKVTLFRRPLRSPEVCGPKLAELLPVQALAKLLRETGVQPRSSRRADLMEAVEGVSTLKIGEAVRAFMRQRYAGATARFQQETRSRSILPQDVERLRVWPQRAAEPVPEPVVWDHAVFLQLLGQSPTNDQSLQSSSVS